MGNPERRQRKWWGKRRRAQIEDAGAAVVERSNNDEREKWARHSDEDPDRQVDRPPASSSQSRSAGANAGPPWKKPKREEEAGQGKDDQNPVGPPPLGRPSVPLLPLAGVWMHCSKAPRFSSALAMTSPSGRPLHVTVTNDAAVVERWILAHAREDLGELPDCHWGPASSLQGRNQAVPSPPCSDAASACQASRDAGGSGGREPPASADLAAASVASSAAPRTHSKGATMGLDLTEAPPSSCPATPSSPATQTDPRSQASQPPPHGGLPLKGGGRQACLLGLDAEWRPSFQKGKQNPVATLQLSTARHCLVVQLLFLNRTPQALKELLAAEDIFFGGQGVKEDAVKLARDHGLECRPDGLLDIQALARAAWVPEGEAPPSALKQMCFAVLGELLEKKKKITMSNWGAFRLTDDQVRYAAMDAWASNRVAVKLMQGPPQKSATY